MSTIALEKVELPRETVEYAVREITQIAQELTQVGAAAELYTASDLLKVVGCLVGESKIKQQKDDEGKGAA